MNVSDFWRCWEHIRALVEEEYKAVEGSGGFYTLELELLWDDCEEDLFKPASGDDPRSAGTAWGRCA